MSGTRPQSHGGFAGDPSIYDALGFPHSLRSTCGQFSHEKQCGQYPSHEKPRELVGDLKNTVLLEIVCVHLIFTWVWNLNVLDSSVIHHWWGPSSPCPWFQFVQILNAPETACWKHLPEIGACSSAKCEWHVVLGNLRDPLHARTVGRCKAAQLQSTGGRNHCRSEPRWRHLEALMNPH